MDLVSGMFDVMFTHVSPKNLERFNFACFFLKGWEKQKKTPTSSSMSAMFRWISDISKVRGNTSLHLDVPLEVRINGL